VEEFLYKKLTCAHIGAILVMSFIFHLPLIT